MSALAETLRALANVLDRHGLRWLVFGAQAVAVRGAPRATQDVDITVQLRRDELPSLLQARAVVARLRGEPGRPRPGAVH